MFIDAHQHVVRVKGVPSENGNNFATGPEIIEEMDRTGVAMGMLQPVASPECMFQLSTTEDILDICEAHPDRFIPFCSIDPRCGANRPDYDFSRMMSYYKERGCKGMGEILAALPINGPLFMNFFKHCEAVGLPCTFHLTTHSVGYYGMIEEAQLPGLETLLKTFPELIFVGHSPVFWAHVSAEVDFSGGDWYYPWDTAVVPGGAIPRMMDAYPNLYADISANSGLCAIKRDPEFGYAFMEKYQDRLFFGTDICSPTQHFEHADYLRACLAEGNISQAAFEKITWENANRVYGLGL